MEVPDHVDWADRRQLVLNEHSLAIKEHNATFPRLKLTLVRLIKIGDCKVGSYGGQRSLCIEPLILTVDRNRIVAFRAQSIVAPALIVVEVAGQSVIIRAKVDCPALTESIEHKGAEVEMCMPGVRISTFEGDVPGLAIVPGATDICLGDAGEALRKRRLGRLVLAP